VKVPSDTVDLHFRVSVQDGLQADSFSALSWIWTSGSATTGIALNGSFVLVKGSFTATGNGKTVSNVPVVFSASKTSPPDFLIWSSRYVWTGNTCNWTFSAEALSPQASVAFTIVNYDDGSIIGTETAMLGTSNITIPLRTYTYTSKVLSGTIGTVTVDGHSVTQFDIYALDPFALSVVGRSTVNGNTWEISGIPGNFSGTLNIMVSAEYSGSYYGTKAGSWTFGTATTGIILGNVNIDGGPPGGGGMGGGYTGTGS
jgi:hypothetical protein